MFTKYIGQFHKAEAEWVQECLDMHDGDEPKAKAAVLEAVDSIIAKGGDHTKLTDFEKAVEAACFASQMWWPAGLLKLRELGRI